MKYLGIDYGTKRIGISISDNTASLAFPLTTLATNKHSVEDIVALAEKHDAKNIVLGESRNFKGAPNVIMQEIHILKVALEKAGYTIDYEPEFMTSAMATREGETAPEQIDASAAALILQSYLDRNKFRSNVE